MEKNQKMVALHEEAWAAAYELLLHDLKAARKHRFKEYEALTQGLTPESTLSFDDPKVVTIMASQYALLMMDGTIEGFRDGEARRQIDRAAREGRPPGPNTGATA